MGPWRNFNVIFLVDVIIVTPGVTGLSVLESVSNFRFATSMLNWGSL